ncbi:MAG TPA: class I fructose-bisphosphate aldolase [Candidatus Saccharimonadales bacterium]|nr:class I fructose-bisphosphate aldolase [Candidatus Saccharimonadales bacterium]
MKYEDQLKATAQTMLTSGKGLLAADESSATVAKRFDAVGLDNTEENRRTWRQLLLTTEGDEQYLSGVILYDETIRQKDDNGQPFAEVMQSRGIVPGIKVDTGAKDLALHPGEKVTEGLDGLRERFIEYADMGAGFAKWRAVITIDGDKLPSEACYVANANALARYAALAQEAGIVPVVEPEVLLDGDHSIERCYDVTAKTLDMLFWSLKNQAVMLEGLILKSSMVISGNQAADRADVQTVAEQTVKCLKEHVPDNVAGVVFLSGGQGEEEATAHLNAMNKLGDLPWPLTFSYSRAIQNPVLPLWAEGEKDKAQAAYLFRCQANSLASKGQWREEFEKDRPY